MVTKGDFVEFKSGVFGIKAPNNFAIYIRRYRDKRSKGHMVELYTVKGIQTTSEKNVETKRLGKSLQLEGNRLPETKILKGRLKTWIMEYQSEREKMDKALEKAGKFSERSLWNKLKENEMLDTAHTVEELAKFWYNVEIELISDKRMSRIREEMKNCQPYGQGYFDLQPGGEKKWKPIDENQFKGAKQEIGYLGNLKNNMFQLVEVPIESEDGEEETEMQRLPVSWENVPLSDVQKTLIVKIQQIMEYFVINDNWPETGLGDTHIYAIDGFSMRNFLSYLAEDWINEGRTSFSDAFVKFLIRTEYWTDTDALLAISQRQVKLAPNFNWEIEERIEEIAARFVEPKETPEAFENRTDLRDLESYTIDPPTAKDFDDAISLQKHKNGYILWVHIADVAHYVEKDTSLDLHARSKATSVYLPTKTLPMLPHHLSDNLCSLREQVPRLAMSVEIHYDKNGNKKLKNCKIHNSVIFVDKNLSYDVVNEAIQDGKSPFKEFQEFSRLIGKHRKGLALETDDVRLELGGQMTLSVKQSSDSTKMIETFMVAANDTVAEILENKSIPVVYRNHPLPDKEDVEKFNAQAKVIGLDHEIEYPDFNKNEEEEEDSGQSLMDMLSGSDKVGGGGSISFTLGSGTDFAEEMKKQLSDKEKEEDETEDVDTGTPFINGLAQLEPDQREEILKPFRDGIRKVEKISDEYMRKLGYITFLRSLSRALYGAGNMGHFGLGSPAYLHFTSPIRRYPDIIAHRVCKAMLASEEFEYDADEIDEIAIHCTQQSEIAERLEKTIVGSGFSFLTRNLDYTQNKEGIVVSIFGGGVFVLLPNGIEARIPMSKLTDKPTFVDDYETMCFVGSRSDYKVQDEITPDNWRELLRDGDEPTEVITKIGDRIAIDFVGWNHVEGKVDAAPIRFLELVEGEYIEREIEISTE